MPCCLLPPPHLPDVFSLQTAGALALGMRAPVQRKCRQLGRDGRAVRPCESPPGSLGRSCAPRQRRARRAGARRGRGPTWSAWPAGTRGTPPPPAAAPAPLRAAAAEKQQAPLWPRLAHPTLTTLPPLEAPRPCPRECWQLIVFEGGCSRQEANGGGREDGCAAGPCKARWAGLACSTPRAASWRWLDGDGQAVLRYRIARAAGPELAPRAGAGRRAPTCGGEERDERAWVQRRKADHHVCGGLARHPVVAQAGPQQVKQPGRAAQRQPRAGNPRQRPDRPALGPGEGRPESVRSAREINRQAGSGPGPARRRAAVSPKRLHPPACCSLWLCPEGFSEYLHTHASHRPGAPPAPGVYFQDVGRQGRGAARDEPDDAQPSCNLRHLQP